MNLILLKKITCFLICLTIIMTSCKDTQKDKTLETNVKSQTFYKLSLAQWSLHKTFNNDGVSPFKFAEIAKNNGFEGIEYVNHLYSKQIETHGFDAVIDSLNMLSKTHGVENVLIMIDGEGDLADPDETVRDAAVSQHKKWVDAAAKLGCHAIRVNTFGTNDKAVWIPSVADGLKKLATYAATKNIKVLCENHGWLSSDAPALLEAINLVNLKNCGTLPDFGNWCVRRKDGAMWGDCIEEYPDKYEGLELLLTKAMAVSAKGYDFDENGNETTLDYPRMLQLVKDSGYKGYIGIEYEGERLSELEGLNAIKNLVVKSADNAK